MKKIQILAFAAISGFMTMNAVAQQQEVKAGYGVTVLQTEPEFPGGIESLKAFLHKNMRYPQQLMESGQGGRVLITFIIDQDGKIVDPTVLKGVNDAIDKEALRVVSLMPDWTPGTNGGTPSSKQYILPLYFVPATQILPTAIN